MWCRRLPRGRAKVQLRPCVIGAVPADVDALACLAAGRGGGAGLPWGLLCSPSCSLEAAVVCCTHHGSRFRALSYVVGRGCHGRLQLLLCSTGLSSRNCMRLAMAASDACVRHQNCAR